MSITRFEDGTAAVTTFLEAERGSVDGNQTQQELLGVMTPEAAAFAFVSDGTRLNPQGYYEVLRPDDSLARFQEANAKLAGRVVIAPFPEGGKLSLYPAVVSIDGLADPSTLKLHILKSPFRLGGLTEDQRINLSAAAQAETQSVGQHGRTTKDSVEAEHFITVMQAAIAPSVGNQWRSGQHPNHAWRQRTSVLDVVSTTSREAPALLPDKITTISLSAGNRPKGFTLYWHEALQAGDRKVEAGDKPKAMVLAQGIGYLTVMDSGKLDTLKALVV